VHQQAHSRGEERGEWKESTLLFKRGILLPEVCERTALLQALTKRSGRKIRGNLSQEQARKPGDLYWGRRGIRSSYRDEIRGGGERKRFYLLLRNCRGRCSLSKWKRNPKACASQAAIPINLMQPKKKKKRLRRDLLASLTQGERSEQLAKMQTVI